MLRTEEIERQLTVNRLEIESLRLEVKKLKASMITSEGDTTNTIQAISINNLDSIREGNRILHYLTHVFSKVANFTLGILFPNNTGVNSTATGGATVTLLKLNASDIVTLANTEGDIAITPKTTTGGLGFWGTTPAVKQTINSYTTDVESGAYSGIPSGLGGSPYAAVVSLELLRVAYENLRTSYDDLRTKLKATTLVG